MVTGDLLGRKSLIIALLVAAAVGLVTNSGLAQKARPEFAPALPTGIATTLAGHGDTVLSAAFSADGRRIVTASVDNTARLWDAASGKVLTVLAGHDKAVRSAAFSPDGRRVVTASEDKTARLWDSETGQALAVIAPADQYGVYTAAFSPDGHRVVIASPDSTALWDAAAGKDETEGLGGKTAQLWDAATGQPVASLVGHQGFVRSAAFSADGSRIVTTSDDGTARLWDAATGKAVATLAGHEDKVNSAVFSPDGRRVLTTSSDKTARLWKVFPTTQDLVDSAEASAGRCLTPEQRSSFYLSPDPPGWCYMMKKWPYQDQEPSPPWYAQAWNEATYWIATKFNDLRGKLGLGAAKQGS